MGPGIGLTPYAAAVRWPCMKNIIWCEPQVRARMCVHVSERESEVRFFGEIDAGGTSNIPFLLPPLSLSLSLSGTDFIWDK